MKNIEFKFKLFEIFREINTSINILISGELYQGQALVPDVIAFLSKHGFSLIGIFNPFYIWNDQNLVQA
jgi:hypothetical protein